MRRPTSSSRTWWYVVRKSYREFRDDQCTDLAAGLTYYAVLAIFPAALALTALLGLVGQADKSVQTVLDVLDPLVSDQTLGDIQPAAGGSRELPGRRARP